MARNSLFDALAGTEDGQKVAIEHLANDLWLMTQDHWDDSQNAISAMRRTHDLTPQQVTDLRTVAGSITTRVETESAVAVIEEFRQVFVGLERGVINDRQARALLGL